MKSNRITDENAAKLLVERSLVYENGKLDFNKDKHLPYFVI